MLLILLCCVIFLPACVKMSLMPVKISLAWGLVWGIAGYFATLLFSGFARQDAYALMNVGEMSALEFVELMIMAAYLFSGGIWKRVMAFYPGLMMIVPVSAVSLLFTGLFPGMDFSVAALIAGSVVAVTMTGAVLLVRLAKADGQTLYMVTVFSALFNILIYGLV